jgi:hypothetical protein
MKKIELSVNLGFENKNPKASIDSFKRGFNKSCLTLHEILEVVQSGGAISFVYKDGKRSVANFEGANFLAVDVDQGLTYKEAISHPVVKKYCGLIYTTASHTKEENKFRLLFVLPRTLTDPVEVRAASRALSRTLSGDMSTTDAARMFFGSKGCVAKVWSSKRISLEYLAQLIEDGRASPSSDTITRNDHSVAVRSDYALKPTDLLIDTKGHSLQLSKIQAKTSVYCPFHRDKNPSAFVARNHRGFAYLYCSKCNLSRWEIGAEPFSLTSEKFDDELIKLSQSALSKKQSKPVSLESFMANGEVFIEQIETQNRRYVEFSNVFDGITFVKSPKGSGKTDALKKALRVDRSWNEPKDKKKKINDVLLIGHRQALIRNLCDRINLKCYLDDSSEEASKHKRYGICLDSLLKVQGVKYRTVVIDEVEQVLAHFLSETLSDNKTPIFREFIRQLNEASQVVVLDADLSWASFLTLTRLVKGRIEANSGNAFPVRFVLNRWKPEGKSIKLHQSKASLIGTLFRCLSEDKRVFFTSNSKSLVDELELSLVEERRKQKQSPLKLIKVTSENSTSTEVQNFIKNIKSEVVKYDIVLTSPSMSTGIDITFDDDKSLVDCVFGAFENRITTHTEIDQQLARVRNPKDVHVWISSSRYNFEVDFEIVKSDYLKSRLSNVFVSAEDLMAGVDYRETMQDFLYMATLITASKRSSYNALRYNFIEYKKSQGVQLTTLAQSDAEDIELGKEMAKAGKGLSIDAYAKSILGASKLNSYDYERLRDSLQTDPGSVSHERRFAMRRFEIESFYPYPITEDLIKKDDRGRLRKVSKLFSLVTNKEFHQKDASIVNAALESVGAAHLGILKFGDTNARLLVFLFMRCPFFKNYTFNEKISFSVDDLKDFALRCRKMKKIIEGQLGVVVRADLEQKAVSQLVVLLKLVGLNVWKAKTQVNAGVKTYYYRLNETLLFDQMKLHRLRAAASKNHQFEP